MSIFNFPGGDLILWSLVALSFPCGQVVRQAAREYHPY